MEKLGIEPQLLLAQIVNFLIILFVLGKLLYKPILGMIEKRKKVIAEGLELTEKMRVAQEKSKEKEEKILTEARRAARNIIEAGEKDGEEARKDIIAAAHKDAEDIIEKGKTEAATLREKMLVDVRHAALELATSMTQRLVSSVLSPADQHKLISKQLKQLEKVK
jgi:F-type H+-transporting ATPase subunit b